MDRIWIVGKGEYSDSQPICAFTSKDEAEAYIRQIESEVVGRWVYGYEPWMYSVPLGPVPYTVKVHEQNGRQPGPATSISYEGGFEWDDKDGELP